MVLKRYLTSPVFTLEDLWNFKNYFAFLHFFVSDHMHLANSTVLVVKNPPADAGDAG